MTQINGLNSNYQKQQINPENYAQKYAEQNNISLVEAKQELRALFGDPSKDSSIPAMLAGSAQTGITPMTNDQTSVFQLQGGPKQPGDPNPLGFSGIMASKETNFNNNDLRFMQGPHELNPFEKEPQESGGQTFKGLDLYF